MIFSFLNVRKHVVRGAILMAVSGFVVATQAAEPLAQGKVPGVGDVKVTVDDVAADIQRIPVDVRAQVLQQTKTMNQLVTNLYTRRALAERAHVEGLDKRPEVIAALALARDKVMSDALLAYVVDKGNTPPDDKALALARTMYKADAKSFQVPEQVKIRHILIATGKDKDDAAAAKQAEALLAQLRSGADFAALAKEHSADPGSADKGGDLGFFAQGRMVPEFDSAAFQLQKPGDLSNLVKTQFGYHILQLQERKPAGQQSFDEVKDALLVKVKQAEVQKGRNELAEQLEATMKLDEPAVKAAIEKLTQQQPAAAQKKP